MSTNLKNILITIAIFGPILFLGSYAAIEVGYIPQYTQDIFYVTTAGDDLTSLSANDYVQCLFIRDSDDGTDDDAANDFDFLALKLYFIREK